MGDRASRSEDDGRELEDEKREREREQRGKVVKRVRGRNGWQR